MTESFKNNEEKCRTTDAQNAEFRKVFSSLKEACNVVVNSKLLEQPPESYHF